MTLEPSIAKTKQNPPRLTLSFATSFLAALTAVILLSSVGLRLRDDSALFRGADLADPAAAALFTIEVVPIVVGILLGLASASIAWLNWTGRLHSRAPASIISVLTLLAGIFLVERGFGPARIVGWMLILASAASLFVELRSTTSRSDGME
jgi:hypothetical protein